MMLSSLEVMPQNTRVWWKVVVGGILVLATAMNLPLYFGGSTQANTGLTLSILAIFGGLYLIYRGLFPSRS